MIYDPKKNYCGGIELYVNGKKEPWAFFVDTEKKYYKVYQRKTPKPVRTKFGGWDWSLIKVKKFGPFEIRDKKTGKVLYTIK